MLWTALLACTNLTPPPETAKTLQVIYTTSVDGEIEPCG